MHGFRNNDLKLDVVAIMPLDLIAVSASKSTKLRL